MCNASSTSYFLRLSTRFGQGLLPRFGQVLFGLFAVLSILTFLGCSSSDKKATSEAEQAYQSAEKLEENERYEESIDKYNEVKNKFPYSKFAVMAELRVADVHFKREAYVESQTAYQLFKELHPRHPQIAYVTFRLALSYFNQLPETIDRDLSVAHRAIYHFDELTRNYPESEHVAEAKEKRKDARNRLGEKEAYIADFYFIRDKFESALGRYEGLLKEFEVDGFAPVALLGAARSAKKAGELDKAKKYFSRLVRDFPSSEQAEEAKDLMEKYGFQ
jgi:outer membrane protein assembly factor BamD